LAEAACAENAGVRIKMMTANRIPKSGRSADDVLAYVSLSVGDIAAEAERLLTPARATA
jgi:hypothetical protein